MRDLEAVRLDLVVAERGLDLHLQELLADLVGVLPARARLDAGGTIRFQVSDVTVHDFDGDAPRIRYRDRDGAPRELACDFIAGCDGFHGVCRDAIPDGVLSTFEREYPFGWLGILAEVAPSSDELVYAHTERGFALLSLRSPQLSRYYLQVDHDEDVAAWPDDRIWSELRARMATDGDWELVDGPIIDRSIAPMRVRTRS